MNAVVLEKKNLIRLRDIDLPLQVGPHDLKIKVHTVGICGSDVHYYKHGRIGPFVVERPMVLGHEASGTVVEIGSAVTRFAPGDRVCMEPGIPDPTSRASRLGLYNIDPNVRFWATPPIHGCLTPYVIHPESFCFQLPPQMSFAEGAMVEPFAVGMQAATKAAIRPGDIALVTGAGPIGMMIALAALASGCSRVLITDLAQVKLDIIGKYAGITPINIQHQDLQKIVSEATDGWGVDVIFEASGNRHVYSTLINYISPGGRIVLVGMPVEPVVFDVVAAQAKEINITTVFRYANMYDRAINLIASGKVDLKPLISKTFSFAESLQAFDMAAEERPDIVKIQIAVDQGK
jgi:D-xylulose reductase